MTELRQLPLQLGYRCIDEKISFYRSCYRSLLECKVKNFSTLLGLYMLREPELEITAGQRTMSGVIVDLTGQTLVLPVMLTGQNSIVLKMK